jgi:long-chain acyl-CoA synthetase
MMSGNGFTETKREGDQLTMSAAKVWDLLDPVIALHPNRAAIVSAQARLSFASLARSTDQACRLLSSLGVRRGTAVAVSAQNSAEIVIAFLAVMRLGARWVGINRALTETDRSRLLKHSGARVFITDSPFAEDSLLPKDIRVLTFATDDATRLWQPSPELKARNLPKSAVDPYAAAAIAYTSGTSGRPKGVVHSQHNMTLPGRYLSTTDDFDSSAITGVCLPLTILNVIVVAVLPSLFGGRPCVILPKLDAATIAAWVHRERITNMSIPPPILYDLVTRGDIEPDSLKTLRSTRTGGAELPDPIRQGYLERFGHRVIGTYGLTEAPSVVAIESRLTPHVPDASGKVLPYLKVHILDKQGSEVPVGQVGEICLGPSDSGPWKDSYRPMLGYWRQLAATRDALADGLVRTGDLGILDENENLFIKDRKDNMILRGGASIYPAQIERVIRSMDGVRDCLILGVPDERLGERVGAVIELDGSRSVNNADVLAHCEQLLAKYQVPESVVFVDNLPRNSMNKVVRNEAKQRMAAQLTCMESSLQFMAPVV